MSSSEGYQEYSKARKEMNEVSAVYRLIDQKLNATLARIQQVHKEQGADQAKSVGCLLVAIKNIRGQEQLPQNTCLKVSIEPENSYGQIDASKEVESIDIGNHMEYPVEYVFDPILSREAIVRITVEYNEEDADPIHEIQIPIINLFQDEQEKWYPINITGQIKSDVSENTSIENAKENDDIDEQVPITEAATGSTESVSNEEPKNDQIEATSEEKEGEVVNSAEDDIEIREQNEDIINEPNMPEVLVSCKINLSEVEALAQNALSLSKQKSELELAKQLAEHNLASARSKYERIQMASKSNTSKKPLPSLRALADSKKTGSQTLYERVSAKIKSTCTPKRMVLAKHITIFVGSVLLFHYGGENFAV